MTPKPLCFGVWHGHKNSMLCVDHTLLPFMTLLERAKLLVDLLDTIVVQKPELANIQTMVAAMFLAILGFLPTLDSHLHTLDEVYKGVVVNETNQVVPHTTNFENTSFTTCTDFVLDGL